MNATATNLFDTTIQTTNIWLKDMESTLGWADRHGAYHALRAVLHALRDRLTVDEVATLGAQLPMLVRGFYYEGWHPADKPLKERHKDEFLSHVAQAFEGSTMEAERVTRATFHVLSRHLTHGEVKGIKHVLPPEIRSMWE